jgi:hypothetical protein
MLPLMLFMEDRSLELCFGLLDQATIDATNVADDDMLVKGTVQPATASLDVLRAVGAAIHNHR